MIKVSELRHDPQVKILLGKNKESELRNDLRLKMVLDKKLIELERNVWFRLNKHYKINRKIHEEIHKRNLKHYHRGKRWIKIIGEVD